MMNDRNQGLPPPSPGTKGIPNPDMPGEKTADWPKAPGPKGPPMNKVGWPEVKAFAAQDLADDKFIQNAIKYPGALHRQLGIPQGQTIPTVKLQNAATKGGVLGRRARLAVTLKKLGK